MGGGVGLCRCVTGCVGIKRVSGDGCVWLWCWSSFVVCVISVLFMVLYVAIVVVCFLFFVLFVFLCWCVGDCVCL